MIDAQKWKANESQNLDPSHVEARRVRLAYDGFEVARDLSVSIPRGRVTAIVGPNASGKSTLLRALARLLRPTSGVVLLDGSDIHSMPTRLVATKLGILPQGPIAPEGITVTDLVSRGRLPHQRWLRPWGGEDEKALTQALRATGTEDLAARLVDELSGGQRQRVWIAMALAQQTDLLLLDEPTAHLDLAHQLEVLELLGELNSTTNRTVVVVLHDLNHAVRWSDHVVALRDGAVVATGSPAEVVTEAFVREVFGVECRIIADPTLNSPVIVPLGRR